MRNVAQFPESNDNNKFCYLTPEGLQKLNQAIRNQGLILGEKPNCSKIAQQSLIHRETVSKIFKNDTAVSYSSINRLTDFLGITLEEDIDFKHLLSNSSNDIRKRKRDKNDKSSEHEPLTSLLLGREAEILDIQNLVTNGAKCILILGSGGLGKTTLAKYYLTQQGFSSIIEFHIGSRREDIASIHNLVNLKLEQLNVKQELEFLASLDRLKGKLQRERIGVLIDKLEPALDHNGQFVEEHRNYIELLRVLTDSLVLSTTLITSREPLCEGLDVQTFKLGGLKEEAWQKYFSCKGISNRSVLAELHKAYGGNALAMTVLLYPIKEVGSAEAYWQEYKTESGIVVELTLENLIREQFNRLQTTQPDAYNLLCRMGCFRYQDVPTVPKKGLSDLLWDIPQGQHLRLIKCLRERSLIQISQEEYFLHEVIRSEAIVRLKESNNWEEINFKAADFWLTYSSKINSSNDAIKLLESFEHYYSVSNWDKAFSIIESRYLEVVGYLRTCGHSHFLLEKMNKLANKLSIQQDIHRRIDLGVSLYYLSRYKEAISHLEIDKSLYLNFPLDKSVSMLRWLCACHLDMGNLILALEYGNTAISLIQKLEEPKDMEIHLLNLMGAAYCNLCDYEDSLQKHYMALEKANNQNNLNQVGYSSAYIAYCKFSKANFFHDFKGNEEILSLLNEAITIFQKINDISSEIIAKCYLSRLYVQQEIFNLAEESYIDAKEKKETLQKSTLFSSPYLENILLITLAQLSSLSDDTLLTSIGLYKRSTELCERMENKFLLAETYYYMGLAYLANGDIEAETYKVNALELFKLINAPNQIAHRSGNGAY